MSITVKVSEANAHFSELLVRIEAGEDVIISRGSEPVVRMSRTCKETDLQLLMNEVRAALARVTPSTPDEILSWRDEGRH